MHKKCKFNKKIKLLKKLINWNWIVKKLREEIWLLKLWNLKIKFKLRKNKCKLNLKLCKKWKNSYKKWCLLKKEKDFIKTIKIKITKKINLNNKHFY
jgi:hypothetical protein